MGYQVYEDSNDYGVQRWAGYGVPAECDMPDCAVEIDRGLGYKCEEHPAGPDDVEEGEDPEDAEPLEGCGLFFCSEHRYDTDQHDTVVPKPDSKKWQLHMLTDESWAEWRAENPAKVLEMQGAVA